MDFLHGGFGIVQGPGQDEGKNETQKEGTLSGEGAELAAYARFTFPAGAKTFNVDVRVGTSFISEEQARANIDAEAHDGVTVQQTRLRVEEEWLEKIGRVEVKGGQEDDRKVFMTGVFHALQVSPELRCIYRQSLFFSSGRSANVLIQTPCSILTNSTNLESTTLRMTTVFMRASRIPGTPSG